MHFIFIFKVKNPRSGIDIRNRPGIPIPDEDPYSIAGSGSSGGSSGNGNGVRDRERSRQNKEQRPPELPPRDSAQYGTKSGSRVSYPMKYCKLVVTLQRVFQSYLDV